MQSTEDFIKHAEGELDEIAMAMRAARGRMVGTFERQQGEVNARLDSLFKQREKYIAELGARELTDESIEEIMQYARDVREGIAGANFDAKRRILESLGVKVTIKDRHYFIGCVLGEVEGEIRDVNKRHKPIVNHRHRPVYLFEFRAT